jgi:glycosyltransferase involved in cell wall biosynthesis
MRLLQALGSGRPGGAEAMFVRLCIALHKRGVEQRILVRDNAERLAALRAAGIDPVVLPFGGIMDLRTGRAFRRQIADFKPGIVLTWMNRATRFCPRPANGRPFVHAARLGGYYDMKNYRGCDHLIGNTQDLRNYFIREGWPEERAHYLPNFVDAEALPAVPRSDHGTPEGVPLLLALGRLHRNKAFDVLLDALANIPDAHLWLAGTGPDEAELKSQAARVGVAQRVHFLGWREDAPALLAAADLLVVPSRYEPLGNVVLEGWAHGVPVVAAESTGPASLIEDGETGVLVPVDDAEALSSAINRLLAAPDVMARLAAKGRAHYDATFTEQAVCDQYLAFFREVLS